MESTFQSRVPVRSLARHLGETVVLRGWVFRLRVLASTTFVILRDASGEVQCVGASDALNALHLKLDDAIEVVGSVRADTRAKLGFEVDVAQIRVLNPATNKLPFNASSDISGVGIDARLEYRPLAARNDAVGDVFRVQGALLRYFREFLTERGFTEIITSKIVASGTEGGTNLFTIDYFDRVAYLAQSPQFYKEHGVAAFEKVFETGHVYRAEPHASSRHLTEYYSLDLEFGFIDAAEDVIRLEKELLTSMFEEAESRARGDAATPRRGAAAVDAECADLGIRRVSRTVGEKRTVPRTSPTTSTLKRSGACARSRKPSAACRRCSWSGSRCPAGRSIRHRAATAVRRRASTCCSAASKSPPAGSACIGAPTWKRRCARETSNRPRSKAISGCSSSACRRTAAWRSGSSV